jgi:hypothetical protein
MASTGVAAPPLAEFTVKAVVAEEIRALIKT